MKYLKRFEAFDQSKIDELIDKGWDNLTSREKEYLKTPDNVNITSKLQDDVFSDKISDGITAKLQIYDVIDNGVEKEYKSLLSINDDVYDCIIYCKHGEIVETDYHSESTPYDDYEGLEYEIDDFIFDAYYEIILR